jgi:CheY-like chemotaxis protein
LENVPAIALTGYASQNDADTAIAAGFDLHLSKPIDPADLAAAVETLLNSKSK